MEDEARAFRPRNEFLRERPDPQDLAHLEEDTLGFFDQARSAFAEGRSEDNLAALDLLTECCSP
jgi:hypothetical protein